MQDPGQRRAFSRASAVNGFSPQRRERSVFEERKAPAVARRSLAVDVVDAAGRHTRAGAEVRVYAAGTRRLISSGLVDTGGGYCSQNVMPVHVATAAAKRVDVEVTAMSPQGRMVVVSKNVDPAHVTRPLVMHVPAESR